MTINGMLIQKTRNQRIHLLKNLKEVGFYGLLIIITAIIVMPVVWMVIISFKTEADFMAYPIQFFPRQFYAENYYDALTLVPFHRYAWNSISLVTMVTVLTVISSSMIGFALARIRGRGRNIIFALVLVLLVIPQEITTIPQYIVYAKLNMINTYWPFILISVMGNPFHIFLFRQFFSALPRELEDAAEVDGANWFRIYWQIFLPNAKPALAVAAILHFNGNWGDFFRQAIYLNQEKATLAVLLLTSYTPKSGPQMPLITVTIAAAVMYVIPVLIMFLFFQKYIMQGVATSGLKG